jgi:hypothetical protein
MYLGFLVKCLIFLSIFNQMWVFLENLKKVSNIKFHENPSSGSSVDVCGLVDRHDEAKRHFT